MSPVNWSLRKPITVIVLMCAAVLCAAFALLRMPRDIFPDLQIPVIYVSQPYGGMSPEQMEGFITYYYEYHFLYITGIDYIETKSIQGAALIKLQFHPGTNMAEAMAETVSEVSRARAFMPPGTVTPFVLRFDAGSVPIGDLVFSSPSRGIGEIQDLALNRVRPLFATLPGVSAPPPFGASQRTIVVTIDPKALRARNLSLEDVVKAINDSNVITPAGNLIMSGRYPIVPMNSPVTDIQHLRDVPLRLGTYPTVFLRDVGKVEDATDIQTGYALVNGRRAIYIPVTKRADASTLAVVALVRKNLRRFQDVLPKDVKVTYEFDQSVHVTRAIRALALESAMGALLTGLMVLLFLRDLRSAAVVVITIPLALLIAIFALWLTGQTINIMTLGGLALAVGVLVDQATVVIENIHTHLSRGEKLVHAVLHATREIILPGALAMLCVLAVFLPSFFMTGSIRALFVPLSLAVGFSMAASFMLSVSFLPVMSSWVLGSKEEGPGKFARWQERYGASLRRVISWRGLLLPAYLIAAGLIIIFVGRRLGTEIFPPADTGQFQIRLRAPTGTYIDQTEKEALKILDIIKSEAGEKNVEMSLGFVGVQPASFAINMIYLFTSGPQEAVLQVALNKAAHISIPKLKERLRRRFTAELPGSKTSFEPADIVSRIMSFGSPTPVEVALSGPDLPAVRSYTEKVENAMAKIPDLRDLQLEQALDYPTVSIQVDRKKAGLEGLTMKAIGQSVVSATSSSRFVVPTYWRDAKSGIGYQIQVEVPQNIMTSIDSVKNIMTLVGIGAVPLHRFAAVISTTTIGEYDHYNQQRMLSLSANIAGEDLGKASDHINAALKSVASVRPTGVSAHVRGQIHSMRETFAGLRIGLLLAIVVIFLLLTANYQSFRLSLAAVSTVPAVISGVVLMLWATGTTLNIQSFMGAIMSIGVAMANAVLLVTFAERSRLEGKPAHEAAVIGSSSRLRPILMTAGAMIVGMLPMASGIGESGKQSAPLGRAVIGGLVFATIATLLILPSVFAVLQARASTRSVSLDPEDPGSPHYEGSGR
jgi:multidrug efflux pump subunit AcrB